MSKRSCERTRAEPHTHIHAFRPAHVSYVSEMCAAVQRASRMSRTSLSDATLLPGDAERDTLAKCAKCNARDVCEIEDKVAIIYIHDAQKYIITCLINQLLFSTGTFLSFPFSLLRIFARRSSRVLRVRGKIRARSQAGGRGRRRRQGVVCAAPRCAEPFINYGERTEMVRVARERGIRR